MLGDERPRHQHGCQTGRLGMFIQDWPRPNSRVTRRHLAEMPRKCGFSRQDDALAATLLTFRSLNRASFRGSRPQDAGLPDHHF
jgi:hypothetical protein